MKKITLLLALLISSIGFSQTYDLLTNGDFENGTAPWTGNNFTVVGGEAFISATNAGGNAWDSQLVHGSLEFENAKEYVLTFYARAAANRKITVAIQNVGVWDDQFRQDFDLTTTMTEFTATFNATSTNANIQIGFLMAGTGSTDAIYFDDISIVTAGTKPETCSDGILNNGETAIDCGGPNCNACPSPPTTAPTAPPARNAWDVVSLYSEAYTPVEFDNFDAGWCGANSVTEVTIAGNKVQQFNGNNCQGIVLKNAVDVSGFTHMHVDVYIDGSVDVTSKVFNLKFVGSPNTIFKEYPFNAGTSPALVAGSWFSIDIPVDLSTLTTFKEFGITADNLKNQVWYDNLYVYRAATASVDKNNLLNVSLSPSPATNELRISAQDVIENVTIYNVLGKTVVNAKINKKEDVINVSGLNTGIYILKYTINNAVGTMKFIKK